METCYIDLHLAKYSDKKLILDWFLLKGVKSSTIHFDLNCENTLAFYKEYDIIELYHTDVWGLHRITLVFTAEEFINKYINMEKGTVKLTLEQAKELYKQGGNFKTIALGAYSKEELEDSLPKTWEEFCEKYPYKIGESWIDQDSNIGVISYPSTLIRKNICDKNLLPDKHYAEAILALCQLIQLRDCYNDGWKPNWRELLENKYVMFVDKGNIIVDTFHTSQTILAFKTEKLRNDFLTNFRDLIEIAKEFL